MHLAAMNVIVTVGLAACWGAFALTWLAGAAYNASRGPASQTSRAPLGSVMLIGAVIVWLAFRVLRPADWQSLLLSVPWARLAGVVLLAGSTAFTLWARFALGTMWSSAPMVKQAHELRTSGPYAVTRHPIYTGILGMLAGTALLAGAGRWILPFPVFLVLYEIKIHSEEQLMEAEFPDDYPRYRKQVPQLVPGAQLIGRLRRAGQ